MNPLEAAALILALLVPIHLLMQREMSRLSEMARRLPRPGVAIKREEALEERAEVIGYYQDCEIYAWVGFMQMRYRFDRVVERSYESRVGEEELYLEPGLLYVACAAESR